MPNHGSQRYIRTHDYKNHPNRQPSQAKHTINHLQTPAQKNPAPNAPPKMKLSLLLITSTLLAAVSAMPASTTTLASPPPPNTPSPTNQPPTQRGPWVPEETDHVHLKNICYECNSYCDMSWRLCHQAGCLSSDGVSIRRRVADGE